MAGNPNVNVDQLRTFLQTYNKLTETCFHDCVHDFSYRNVSTNENSCAMNCAEKFLKMSQRIGVKFQEVQFPDPPK